MPRVFLILLAALATAAPASAAVWGAKSRHCGRLTAHLAAVEQNPSARPERVRRLRERVANRCVALNEIQVLGSHNSFHVQPRPALFAALLELAQVFEAWEYTHLPLDEQFATQGVRQIELDVYADPDGGLFSRRGALLAVGEDPESGIPELSQPGLKVLHIHDVDFETTCLTFVECLQTVKAWSDANPRHLPIMILVEAKEDVIPDIFGYGFATPIPFGAAELDTIDAEIRSVFPASQVVTPDRIRRGQATLEEAVLDLGWPRLGALRGKVLFALDNGGLRDTYAAGHPSLAGRMMFTDGTPGTPEAAFVKRNDPFAPDIGGLVTAGYVVRTRADSDTVEARSGDTGPRDAALASGAQWVSTDFPEENPAFGTGYFVAIPGGMPGRCNPLTAPAGCRDAGLERLP